MKKITDQELEESARFSTITLHLGFLDVDWREGSER